MFSQALTEPLSELGNVSFQNCLHAFLTRKVDLQTFAQFLHAHFVIGNLSPGQLLVQLVNEDGNEAVGEDLTRNDQPLFHIERNVNQSPVKFVLQTVFEVGCLSVAPIPLVRVIINLAQLFDLFQVFYLQIDLVYGRARPVLRKGFLEGFAVGSVVDSRCNFL